MFKLSNYNHTQPLHNQWWKLHKHVLIVDPVGREEHPPRDADREPLQVFPDRENPLYVKETWTILLLLSPRQLLDVVFCVQNAIHCPVSWKLESRDWPSRQKVEDLYAVLVVDDDGVGVNDMLLMTVGALATIRIP